MRLEWLDNAREDMFALYAWYAQSSVAAAAKLYNAILDDVELLAGEPRLGAVEPLLAGLEYEFRSLVTSTRNHKIIYFIDGDTVFVTRIWDCRQNPQSLTV